MTIEEEMSNLSAKVEEYHRQEIARANQDKYSKMGFILWAFGLGTMSFMIELPNLGNISMSVVFFVAGAVSLLYSVKFRTK